MDELKSLDAEYHRLETETRTFEEAAKQTEVLEKQILRAKEDQALLQRQFNELVRQPFFKRETDQSTYVRISELQKQVEERERQIKDSMEGTLKAEEQIR